MTETTPNGKHSSLDIMPVIQTPSQAQQDLKSVTAKFERLDDDIRDLSERRAFRENVAEGCIRLGVEMVTWGKFALWKNIRDGSWQTARDRDGNPYPNGMAYFMDWFTSHVETISARTAYADFSNFDAMSALGVSEDAQRRLITIAPSITGKVISEIIQIDDRTDEVTGIVPDYRERMERELGVEEGENLTDKELAAEFLEHMSDLNKSDAGALAQKILREWKYRLSWREQEQVFVLNGWQSGNPNDSFEVILTPLDTRKSKEMRQKSAWRKLLKRLQGGRFV